MQQSQRNYSLEEYFDVESHSDMKFEYFSGQIFAMTGASFRYNQISLNIAAALRSRLRGSRCRPLGSDMRVGTASGLYTYPDGVIVCGEPVLSRHPADRGETLMNPSAIFEVLSRSTRLYDMGEKFDHYRSIASIRECIFVEQESIRVEHRKLEEGEWRSTIHEAVSDVLRLVTATVELPLADVYEDVFV